VSRFVSLLSLRLRKLKLEVELFNQYPVRKILPEYPYSERIFKKVERQREFGRIKCRKCDSERTIKYGNSKGWQIWLCRDCGYHFRNNGAAYGARIPAKLIMSILELFYEGKTPHEIQKEIESAEGKRLSESGILSILFNHTHLHSQRPRAYRLCNSESEEGGGSRARWERRKPGLTPRPGPVLISPEI
jgi:ribosomal protein L37AE/L43A